MGQPAAVDYDPFEQKSAAPESVDYDPFTKADRGFLTNAAVGVGHGAMTGVGNRLSGTAELANARPFADPYYGAYSTAETPEDFDALRQQLRTDTKIPTPLAATINQQISERQANGPVVPYEDFVGTSPPDTALGRAGASVKASAQTTFPMSSEQSGWFSGMLGEGLGDMGSVLASALIPGIGPAVAAAQMGLEGAGSAAERARAKGASEEQVGEAAAKSGILNTAAGVADLGVLLGPAAKAVLAPIERMAPGIARWSLAKLQQAAQNGITFEGIGEAQAWLQSQIDQGFDPDAKYDPTVKQAAVNALTGIIFGAPRGTGLRSPEQIAAETGKPVPPAGRPYVPLGPDEAAAPPGESPPATDAPGRSAQVKQFIEEQMGDMLPGEKPVVETPPAETASTESPPIVPHETSGETATEQPEQAPVAEQQEQPPAAEAPPVEAPTPYSGPAIVTRPMQVPKDLLTFLSSKGGVQDDGDQLRQINAQDWKPKRGKKLIQDSGMPPDYAREAAVAAGYLPENATLPGFYKAIDGNLRGDPIYSRSEQGIVDAHAKYQDAIDYARARADEIGLDHRDIQDKDIQHEVAAADATWQRMADLQDQAHDEAMRQHYEGDGDLEAKDDTATQGEAAPNAAQADDHDQRPAAPADHAGEGEGSIAGGQERDRSGETGEQRRAVGDDHEPPFRIDSDRYSDKNLAEGEARWKAEEERRANRTPEQVHAEDIAFYEKEIKKREKLQARDPGTRRAATIKRLKQELEAFKAAGPEKPPEPKATKPEGPPIARIDRVTPEIKTAVMDLLDRVLPHRSIYDPFVESSNFHEGEKEHTDTRWGHEPMKGYIAGFTSGELARTFVAIGRHIGEHVKDPTARYTWTARHETLHALRSMGLFTRGEWDVLQKAAGDHWTGTVRPDGVHVGVEEAIAEAYAAWGQQGDRVLKGLGPDLSPKVARIFSKIRDFYNRVVRSMQGVHRAEWQRLFSQIESGEIGRRKPGEFEGEKRGDFRWYSIEPSERGDSGPRTEQQIAQAELDLQKRVTGYVSALKAPFRMLANTPPMKRFLSGETFSRFQKGVDDFNRSLLMGLTPSAVGSQRAQAAAKQFANGMREVNYKFQQLDQMLSKIYKPAERAEMGRALDEQSVMDQTGTVDPKRGLGSLTDDQRATVKMLDDLSRETWRRLYEAGIVKSEQGLPAYMPRQFVNIVGPNGEIQRLSGTGPGVTALDPVGRNLSTAGPGRRKYLTPEETEAAAKAKFGNGATLVTDIRSLLTSLARSQKAIAGKKLIDQVKKIGEQAGTETVVNHDRPDFFTIDHPAFKVWEPMYEFDQDGGYKGVKQGDDGNPVMVQKPLYVAREFEGPLRSVLTKPEGAVYRALMQIKMNSIGLIMYSPAIHNMVIYGRAFPMMPGRLIAGQLYFSGNKLKHDPAVMKDALAHGLVPIGSSTFLPDTVGIMREAGSVPGNSLLAKGAGNLAGVLGGDRANMAVRRGVDAAGKFWHGTLLWDRVADLQMGMYGALKQQYVAKGYSPDAAATIAAHQANRAAGALPAEAMSNMVRKISNVGLFSRSFTLGNLGSMKDMLNGLPRDTYAKLERDIGKLNADAARSAGRRKAIGSFMKDLALFYGMKAAAQSMIAYMSGDQSGDEIAQGYWRRLKSLGDRVSKGDTINPFNMIDSLTPNSENEPGKEDRIYMGRDETGRALYARNPLGKVPEELKNYAASPLQTLKNKMSPMTKPIGQTIFNTDDFGRQIYNADDSTLKIVGDIVTHFMEAQVPWTAAKGAYNTAADFVAGRPANSVEALKTLAPLGGITVSSGYPGGPEVGVEAAALRDRQRKILDSRPAAARLVRVGDLDSARQTLIDAGETPVAAARLVSTMAHPEKRNAATAKKFNRTATEEQRQRLENVTTSRPQP